MYKIPSKRLASALRKAKWLVKFLTWLDKCSKLKPLTKCGSYHPTSLPSSIPLKPPLRCLPCRASACRRWPLRLRLPTTRALYCHPTGHHSVASRGRRSFHHWPRSLAVAPPPPPPCEPITVVAPSSASSLHHRPHLWRLPASLILSSLLSPPFHRGTDAATTKVLLLLLLQACFFPYLHRLLPSLAASVFACGCGGELEDGGLEAAVGEK